MGGGPNALLAPPIRSLGGGAMAPLAPPPRGGPHGINTEFILIFANKANLIF